ncbi:envelope stress response membrane protein PspC [Wenzhouxiangella marina]|nr:envelope stress response membrane protein PspC [Wenzhouxiangella marina]
MSRNRLYRNKNRALIGGVCAGISDWMGVNLTALRIITVVLAIPFTAVVLIGYLVLWVLVPKRPSGLYRDSREEAFWKEVRRSPTDSVGQLNRRYRELDNRLQKMEAWLTSSEYRIDRELRD